MKTIIATLALSISAISAATETNIGENFIKGSFEPTGSLTFWSSDFRTYIEVAPGINYYVADQLFIGASIEYTNISYEDLSYVDYSEFDVKAGLGYTFGYDGNTQSGLAHRVFANLGVNFDPDNNFEYNYTNLVPMYSLQYFFNPRIATYLSVSPGEFVFAEGADVWYTDLGGSLGFTYHIPVSNKSLF